jgi:hypothetical protein
VHGAVTEYVDAPPAAVWALVSDITNTGRFSPETFEAEWLDGATGPAVGTRFRGHVRRGGRGPVYWTVCRITACEAGREFGFDVLGPNDRVVNRWHYAFVGEAAGTAVTESFRLGDGWPMRVYWALAGWVRGRYNDRNMRATLLRIKAVAEGSTEPA